MESRQWILRPRCASDSPFGVTNHWGGAVFRVLFCHRFLAHLFIRFGCISASVLRSFSKSKFAHLSIIFCADFWIFFCADFCNIFFSIFPQIFWMHFAIFFGCVWCSFRPLGCPFLDAIMTSFSAADLATGSVFQGTATKIVW